MIFPKIVEAVNQVKAAGALWGAPRAAWELPAASTFPSRLRLVRRVTKTLLTRLWTVVKGQEGLWTFHEKCSKAQKLYSLPSMTAKKDLLTLWLMVNWKTVWHYLGDSLALQCIVYINASWWWMDIFRLVGFLLSICKLPTLFLEAMSWTVFWVMSFLAALTPSYNIAPQNDP